MATVVAAFAGTMGEVSGASIKGAKSAVELSISLIGQMALWLGVMQVLEDAGFLKKIAQWMRPVMVRLFPEVPADHPAMSAMILNIAANMMGLANAATPFGIKAMLELNKLNKHQGVATNSMALFLAINTSGVAVLPTGIIAVRASMGAADPAGIFLPSILATMGSTIVTVITAKFFMGRARFSAERAAEGIGEDAGEASAIVKGLDAAKEKADLDMPRDNKRFAFSAVVLIALAVALGRQIWTGTLLSPEVMQRADGSQLGGTDLGLEIIKRVSADWTLPMLMLVILLVGFSYRVKVYESVVKGAKQGFSVGVMIIPFLVAILVAIGMFRASGAMDAMVAALGPITGLIGLPAEALPMAIVRPLSGSGALGVVMETMKAHGPDSFVGFLVSVMSGSTETTFYVLAVYYGAIGVRAVRHTVLACLAADFAGILGATFWAHVFFG